MNMSVPPVPRGQSDWIQTFTGRQFWPLDPRVEEVDIADVAHALANCCRFTGHVISFYSVAQHSVLVARLVEKWFENSASRITIATTALMHDASEAYLIDVPRPLKRAPVFGELYRGYEDNLMEVISQAFGLLWPFPEQIKLADTILLMTERRDLMLREPRPWKDAADPIAERIVPWSPEIAKREFPEWSRLQRLRGTASV